MRVFVLTAALAGLALATATASDVAAADAKKGGLCHVVCSDTPAPPPPPRPARVRRAPVHVVKPGAPVPLRHIVRHLVRHPRHHYAQQDYYSYREAERVGTEFRDEWHQAPSDAMIPGPGYYQQSYVQGSSCDCAAAGGAGLQIDGYGWTGGVGYAASGGEFMDGYGVMHFGGGFQNGPTYNSYGQSFQFNASRPGAFQPRVMGGVAVGGRAGGGFAGGARVGGGFGFHR